MVKPFADAAFGLDKPGFTDVVETEYGFHVIQVTGVKGGGEKPLAEVKPQLVKMWREHGATTRLPRPCPTWSMSRPSRSSRLPSASS